MSSKLLKQRSLQKRIQGVTMPISRKRMKWGRNWLCLCGSKIKYKNCCIGKIGDLTASDGNAQVEALSEDIQRIIDNHKEARKKGDMKRNG